MRRALLAGATAMLAVASPNVASAATYINYTTNVGGTFGNDDPTVTAGKFSNTFSFVTTLERLVTVRLFSSYPTGNISQNVNFVSNGVKLNTTVIPVITRGQFEERSLFNFRLPAGTYSLFVNGSAQPEGTYFGQILLSGIPEPATWGLMVLGVGAAGAMMRRRNRKSAIAA